MSICKITSVVVRQSTAEFPREDSRTTSSLSGASLSKQLHKIIIALLLGIVITTPLMATTYYVRPDGNDDNSGINNTAAEAWCSIDRGQPTWLRKACKVGDTVLQVVKTTQFPESGKLRIGKNVVTYTGKTFQSFTGCSNVPNAKISSLVYSKNYICPGAGDTVVVARGVYTLNYDKVPDTSGGKGLAVAMIAKGGTEQAPLIFRGEGLPVVDAESENKVRSFLVRADYVYVDSFDIRRGGFWGGWSRGSKVLNCRIHEGSYALLFAYSDDVEIAFNKVYDFKGAWTVHGITLNQCKSANIHHNTIVSSADGIVINGGSNIDIGNNLIAWCRNGIRFGTGRKTTDFYLHDNNLWWIRGGIWLQRDDNNKSDYRYVNCKPGTNDVSVESMIVNWDPAKPDFLDYHPDSPAVRNGNILFGAGKVANGYPDSGNQLGENLIFNPSFESGFLGWVVDTWLPFKPGKTAWDIVEKQNDSKSRCFFVYDHAVTNKNGGKYNAKVRIRSQNFRYTRGRALTLSCLAKAKAANTILSMGFTVPSWQNKSGAGKRVQLTKEWQRYSYTVILPDRFPDYAAATFTTYNGDYWIDDVKVEEGTNATAFSPALEFVVDWTPGMLMAPDKPLTGHIINRMTNLVNGIIRGELATPLNGVVAEIEQTFVVDAEKRVPISIKLPKSVTDGIFLFTYTLERNGVKSSKKQLRFSVGSKPQYGRNHDFFAATPNYRAVIPGALLNKQMQALSVMGIGTLHIYMGYKRINEILSDGRVDALVDAARKYGIQFLFTPSDAAALTGKATWAPGPGLVGPDAIEYERTELTGGRLTPVQLKTWDDVIRMLAEKMKGHVKYYEILNEPNCFLSGDEYTNILLRTSNIIRKADSSAQIIGGSVVNATRKDLWNKTMAVPAGTFDAFSYHPYRFGLSNPERENMSYRADLLRAKEDLATNGQPAKVWLTEEGMGPSLDETRCIGKQLGYSAIVRKPDWGRGEILQAQYAARMYATALGEGGGGYSYHTLNGLVQDSLMSPMLALKAIHTMASLLGDAEPLGQINIGYSYICYLFRTDAKDIIAVIWAKDVEYAMPTSVSINTVGKLSGVNLFGYPVKIKHKLLSDNYSFDIGKELIYLTFADVTEAYVVDVLRNGFRVGK